MKIFINKLKWWWEKHDVVYVWDEMGTRAHAYRKVPNKNWWETAEYRKITPK